MQYVYISFDCGCLLCRVEQQRFQSEMDKLQHALEAKEAQMQRVVNGTGQVSALKQHYDRVLMDLAGERDVLQADRTRLLQVRALLLHAGSFSLKYASLHVLLCLCCFGELGSSFDSCYQLCQHAFSSELHLTKPLTKLSSECCAAEALEALVISCSSCKQPQW